MGSALGRAGQKLLQRHIMKCIGRPLIAERLSEQVKHPATKIILIALSNLRKLNYSQRESLKAYISGKATAMDKNIAERLLGPELEKARLLVERTK